ncbi:hypothetical protein DPMN_083591 [Dreissena polymorpha]|uniref:Uncharacterized protein n=1 Tax=Dreissena polymorpha TaxID=45954 RepID=A0A9D4BK01_DREPO|nr:hypothetical protein DPMN_083591 [Dreissena polymorpha]
MNPDYRQSLNLMVSRPITIQIQELHSSRHHERPLKAQGSSRRKAGHSLENRDALVQKVYFTCYHSDMNFDQFLVL